MSMWAYWDVVIEELNTVPAPPTRDVQPVKTSVEYSPVEETAVQSSETIVRSAEQALKTRFVENVEDS